MVQTFPVQASEIYLENTVLPSDQHTACTPDNTRLCTISSTADAENLAPTGSYATHAATLKKDTTPAGTAIVRVETISPVTDG